MAAKKKRKVSNNMIRRKFQNFLDKNNLAKNEYALEYYAGKYLDLDTEEGRYAYAVFSNYLREMLFCGSVSPEDTLDLNTPW